jgi:glutathione peroxidase-family protein
MGHVCAKAKTTDKSSFTELTAKDIDGNVRNMSDWKGKVVLVANVASA